MHFGDEDQVDENCFQIMIRKSSQFKSGYELGTISCCRYVHPFSIYSFFHDYSRGKPFKKYISFQFPSDGWYKCTFKDDATSLQLVSVENENQIYIEPGLFQFVIYKHSNSGYKSKPWYQLTSVQECNGIDSETIGRFWMRLFNHERRIQRFCDRHLVGLTYERWYLFTMAVMDRGGFKVVSVMDVKDLANANAFYTLH